MKEAELRQGLVVSFQTEVHLLDWLVTKDSNRSGSTEA
jgi:hypothetical protein